MKLQHKDKMNSKCTTFSSKVRHGFKKKGGGGHQDMHNTHMYTQIKQTDSDLMHLDDY